MLCVKQQVATRYKHSHPTTLSLGGAMHIHHRTRLHLCTAQATSPSDACNNGFQPIRGNHVGKDSRSGPTTPSRVGRHCLSPPVRAHSAVPEHPHRHPHQERAVDQTIKFDNPVVVADTGQALREGYSSPVCYILAAAQAVAIHVTATRTGWAWHGMARASKYPPCCAGRHAAPPIAKVSPYGMALQGYKAPCGQDSAWHGIARLQGTTARQHDSTTVGGQGTLGVRER